MVNYITEIDVVFSALADPTRMRIVERLAQGELTVGEIASGFSMSQPAISKHVKVLERSGLLTRRVVGRVHHCRLVPDRMRDATAWLRTQERFWNAALDNLGNETEFVLTHENFASAESRDGHNEGWSSALDKLATIL